MAALKRAVGYVRCSTEEQADSPEQQRIDILAFAEPHGYIIVGWFVDFGKSGTTFDQRPEFQKMRRSVENKPSFEAVICWDESRWARAIDPEESTYWRVYFRKCGVDVVLVKTSVDRDNDFAPMLRAFEGVKASQYVKELSELTLRGAKNNGVHSNGGTAPYGYIRIGINLKHGTERVLQPGDWAISNQEKVRWGLGDAKEIETVKFIFDKRADGKACVLIADELNRSGVPCAQRGRWRNMDRKWSAITIKTIIENPVYYGARVYNRISMSRILAEKMRRWLKSKGRPHFRNEPSEWIVVEDAHEAIVSRELWEKANSVRRQQRSNRNGHTYRSQFLLSGLIKCSACGFAFQGWTGKVGDKSYARYVDGGWQNKRVCSSCRIMKDAIEQHAMEIIQELLYDPNMQELVVEKLDAIVKGRSQFSSEEDYFAKKLRSIEDAQKKWIMEFERGECPQAIVERIKELENEKKAVTAQLEKSRITRPTLNVADIMNKRAEFLYDFKNHFSGAPIERRKEIIKRIIPKIIIDREENVARFFVRLVPEMTNELEWFGAENEKALTESVSARSSGGRT